MKTTHWKQVYKCIKNIFNNLFSFKIIKFFNQVNITFMMIIFEN